MKTMLVPTAPHERMTATLRTALLMARRFESYVEGFALRQVLPEVVSVDMVMGLTWTAADRGDEDVERQARRMFEDFMHEAEVPRDVGAPGGLGHRWMADAPAGDDFVGSHSRIFDVTVLGRPGQTSDGPRMTTLEAVLFEGGRPVLLAPPTPPETLGETVVIAWNGSTETAHAVAFAMPVLARAQRIVVLTIEGGTVPGPTGEQLARSLQRHRLPVTAMTVAPGRRSQGEAILDEAARLGCDLLVKGAYTQSRLRQMIFGGATSHILAEANVPVFMAH